LSRVPGKRARPVLKGPGHGDVPRLPDIWGVLAGLEAAGLITLADKGHRGSSHAKIPYRGRSKPESQKQANRAHAKLRAPGERANAQLKNWSILRKLRCCPWRAGQLAKAIHVLQVREA
jgi:hypothetical protein